MIWIKFLDSLKETDVRYYPDVDKAKQLIASHEDVAADQLTLGAGSDQVIRNIFETFVNTMQEVVTTDPCFPMYNVYGKIYDVIIKAVPYKNQVKDVQGIINAINDRTSLVIISNPNSPVGDSFTHDELLSILSKAAQYDAIVVVDEAYIEFATDVTSMVEHTMWQPNLIVLKTFSKAVGAAGIRFGYGISTPLITSKLSKVKSMYEITGPTIRWVEVVLSNYNEIAFYCAKVKMNRDMLIASLKHRYEVIPSQCNWIHTTKMDYPDDIVTRTCKLPWSDKEWTRLCIPASTETLLRIAQ